MMIKLKTTLSVLMVGLFGILCAQPTASESEFIKVDQFGYLSNSTKVGVISNPQVGYNAGQSFSPGSTYQLREWQSGNVVLSGSPQAWNGGATHNQSGDQGWWFDFSSINTPGTYYIYDAGNNVRSPGFDIGETVYNEVLKASMRMFYYNRCNTAKVAPYAESNWTDGTSFLNNLQDANSRYIFDQNNAATEKDLSGGWYDAGDFNKYVTFADRVMHDLLWAYQENPDVFTDNWNIPESGNGIPDLIDEIKWELEWLLKMNNSDGSTHLKMGSQNYSENTQVPPSSNTDPRFYGPTCTSASISVAGVFAHAAKVFSDFPSMNSFVQELQNSAETSWTYVLPLINNNQFETSCDNGEIISGDADWNVGTQREKALKAAIHLFDLTGNNTYNQYIIANLNSDAAEQVVNAYWAPYKMPLNDALLLYATLNGADASSASAILNAATNDANGNGANFYGFDNSDLYRAHMPDGSYHWGSNLPKAGTGVINQNLIKYNINPGSHASYGQKAKEVLHYFHGVNPLGITYLTNMYSYGAERCANEMYHQWFSDGTAWDNALTSQYGPAPGYIVGGANKDFTLSASPPAGQPPQKSYLDFNTGYPENSWEISEPAIYYQAIYVRLLASVIPANACPPAGTACNDNDPTTENDQYDGNCNCTGTPCPAAGQTCNDNDPNTLNDMTDGFCACVGTYCPPAGTACDDNDPATYNDDYDANCNCAGIACPAVGTPCNDGDPNTDNDVENGFCECSGTPPVSACELLTNSGFDNDAETWVYWNCAVESIGGIVNITAINPEANPWDVGFSQNQTGIIIEQGENYEIVFRARADANRTLDIKVGAILTPFTTYHYETINLTTTMQVYTLTFTMTNPTDNNASFDFYMGGNSTSVYIDYASVQQSDCVPCPPAGTACNDNDPATYNDQYDGNCTCIGTACPALGTSCDDGDPNTINDVENGFCDCNGTPAQNACELLTNNNFDTNVDNWNNWNCLVESVGGVANITAINPGVNPWDVGFNQNSTGITLGQNTEYTISFRARADANRPFTVKIGQAVDPFTLYHYETVNLTTSMEVYTLTFIMTEPTDNNAGYELYLGGNPSNVYIDYASLVESGCGGVAEVELDICAWLEGCYDSNTGNMNNTLESLSLLTNGQPYAQPPWNYSGSETLTGTGIADWVMVSFRTGIDKESEVGRLAGLLQQDGCINFQNESGLSGGFSTPVYIVLEQRNHLPAMTPQAVTIVNNTLTYDFRTANSYVTGSSYGQKQLPGGDWSLHAGDINQTDVGGYDVNGSDKAIWQTTNGLFSEYFPADLNMDGDVNGADKSLWNSNNGVFSGVPK